MSLIVSQRERVLHVVLDRAHKRNALNLEMCRGIADAIKAAQQRPDVGCILLSANGPVFCAGMDLDEAATAHGPELAAAREALFSLGHGSLKPIVAAVNGAALGGGFGLAAQGHFLIAAEGASFALPEIQVGLWPFLVYRSLIPMLGARRLLEISLTGESIKAERALEWGIACRIAGSLETDAHGLASQLAHVSPEAVHFGMQYVRDSAGQSWTEAGTLAAELRAKLMESADFKEGVRAFKEKRPPRWPGISFD